MNWTANERWPDGASLDCVQTNRFYAGLEASHGNIYFTSFFTLYFNGRSSFGSSIIAAAFFLPALPVPATARTYTVTSETDAPGSLAAGDGVCSAIVSATFVGDPPVLSFKFGCTLRATLMEDAFDNAATTINFAAGMAGKTINWPTANGALVLNSDDTAIDGELDGNQATWEVTIDGSALATSTWVLVIKGSYGEN